jgi:hypothetical protein
MKKKKRKKEREKEREKGARKKKRNKLIRTFTFLSTAIIPTGPSFPLQNNPSISLIVTIEGTTSTTTPSSSSSFSSSFSFCFTSSPREQPHHPHRNKRKKEKRKRKKLNSPIFVRGCGWIEEREKELINLCERKG